MKDAIVAAATAVLLRDGLQRWSVDRVAAEAGCAKGLVAYHHGSKKALLAAVASGLAQARFARRLTALEGTGATALDRLWQALVDEVQEGEWAAWVALISEPGVASPPQSPSDLSALASAIGLALEIPTSPPDETRLTQAALDGFQLALHLGAPEAAVHEAYHRLWLALLP